MSQPTREKILDAVFKLVYINGYNGTSMAMILKECGIPKGSLYHYFKSKKAMVLAVVSERINPRMDEFYQLNVEESQEGIDTLLAAILKVSKKELLVSYGCPLNRLNQEMSPVDADFEKAINNVYNRLRDKITLLLENSQLQADVDKVSLSEFIIATVWGSISLSPTQSSTSRYMQTITHLINYLKSLKV
ncbi:TetR/AcrR family transcriptional regulator [Sulfurimonas sp. SAG-AH-194-C20]|nr:TetR/AcrR family transcriptional regulator [Sulfurimonas sp. SAG-AH-194-C20]MDF1878313.1 TetR/AcrR family transcriptional regulator [Sulfurimonas sp. SAG-AH-194-C20]